jgi:aspartate aminotransferase
MPTVADRIDLLHISPIRRAAALAEARQDRDIISFGAGAPSLLPPQEVLDEMIRMLKEEPKAACSYVGTRGFTELRRLISEDFARHPNGSNLPGLSRSSRTRRGTCSSPSSHC